MLKPRISCMSSLIGVWGLDETESSFKEHIETRMDSKSYQGVGLKEMFMTIKLKKFMQLDEFTGRKTTYANIT
jgi:hypothetical protein